MQRIVLMRTCVWSALIALFTVTAVPSAAHAQATRSGPTFRIGGTTSPIILPDVAYDPMRERYLVVSGNGFIEGQLLNKNGTKTRRCCSIGTGRHTIPASFSREPRMSGRLESGEGNFNPRVVANEGGRYLTVTSSKFAAVHGQFAGSVAAPPPGSAPRIFLDSPANGSLVQPTFSVGGWAVDLGSPVGSGTGVPTVHVWARPTGGAPAIFLGGATMGIGRPDIAAH
jgi:hypothetical protein